MLSRLARAKSTRRDFLLWSGVAAAAAATGCGKGNPAKPPEDEGISLGSGDVAVLNYVYALEQLQAAFYTQVVAAPYAGMPADELQLMIDIRDHEVIHRQALKAMLGTNAIQDLSITFASVDFTSRASVLGAASNIEDIGVSAHGGATPLVTSASNLQFLSKIASVEGRHASALRDLRAPKTEAFAGDDVVSVYNGLENLRVPSEVLASTNTYIATRINRGNLP